MAQEWAPSKIRVNVLSPGPFHSEMVAGAARLTPGFLDLIADGTLMKRVADPTEIVGPVVYLASDASSFVTGDDISVSGGMMKEATTRCETHGAPLGGSRCTTW